MYVGMIESDTIKYQLGRAQLKEWRDWVNNEVAVEADKLPGDSMSNDDLYQ